MRIIYVDDEPLAVQKFELMASEIPGITSVCTFTSADEALSYAQANAIDAAFLDIEMPGIRGLDLAKLLKATDENIRIFFVTAYDQYALDAFEVDAMGYILKPFSKLTLEKEVGKALRMRNVPKRTVYIQTIPSFEVYIDGALFPISSHKPKELLALLVDRNGGSVSSRQAISLLWEDKPDDESTGALYRMTYKRLREILTDAGIDFILGSEGSLKFIRPDTFACDYFRFLLGDQEATAKYSGEYMTEYSWAEVTNARMTEIKFNEGSLPKRPKTSQNG